MIVELSDVNFKKEILEAKVPCLVDFWATWCGPCKMLAPILEHLSEKYKDKIIIGKYDVENGGSLSGNYGIVSLPTILFFSKGKVVTSIMGLQPRSVIEDRIENELNAI